MYPEVLQLCLLLSVGEEEGDGGEDDDDCGMCDSWPVTATSDEVEDSLDVKEEGDRGGCREGTVLGRGKGERGESGHGEERGDVGERGTGDRGVTGSAIRAGLGGGEPGTLVSTGVLGFVSSSEGSGCDGGSIDVLIGLVSSSSGSSCAGGSEFGEATSSSSKIVCRVAGEIRLDLLLPLIPRVLAQLDVEKGGLGKGFSESLLSALQRRYI